ncbi:hypothetical protein [Tenacibaculum agarivorans]|uniref:hypothetical protein n=1 Tax=Tenacibaculum agarivorans TaxID=1908389 RepID=UPI00094B8758|nr:hypothetical protein [Tenacibaculum agarivorans]
MELHQAVELAKTSFAKEFPHFLSFMFTEIRVLYDASEFALIVGDKKNSRCLELKAKKLSNSLENIIKHYSVSSFIYSEKKEK